MQAGETTLKEIIQGEKQYIVPLFQRSYSWGKPQWEQLWSDIVELLENESNSPHFFRFNCHNANGISSRRS